MFSQLSYFWSPEFWGGLKSRMSRGAKLSTVLLLLITGSIAATAGPASAVLLVPRIRDWEAGGSEFYLQGDSEIVFPRVLRASSLPEGTRCVGQDRIQYSFCPSGGYTPLALYASQLGTIKNGANMRPLTNPITDQFRHRDIFVPSNTPGVTATRLEGSIRGVACQTSIIAPYVPVVTYQFRLMDEWLRIVNSFTADPARLRDWSAARYRSNFGDTLLTLTKIPAVRTACTEAQNISAGVTTMRIPVVPPYSCQGGERTLSTPLLDQPPSDSLRTTWMPLPPEFGSASTGLIFETPWVGNGSSRAVVGCSVDARWADGRVSRDTGRVRTAAPQRMWEPHLRPGYWITMFRPTPAEPDAWRHINISTSWLAQLAPALPDTQLKTNLTTLETVLDRCDLVGGIFNSTRDATSEWNLKSDGGINRTITLEWLTSVLVADGISRHRMEQELDLARNQKDWNLVGYHRRRPDYKEQLITGGTAIDPPSSGEYTTFSMSITINGLSYSIRSVTDCLAIAILSTHILLVIGHSAYLMWRRKSSAAWDSTAEVLALAHNSRPSHRALRNTSAGIQCLQTYGKIAGIRVRPADPAEADAEAAPRVELVMLEEEKSEGKDGAQDVEAVHTGVLTSPGAEKQDAAVSIWPLENGAAGQSSGINPGSNSPPTSGQRRTPLTRVVPGQVYG
ncbi:hypothetical protein B0T16DRAFT_411933 [Cercophora newfieldiana]|uniref:Uncharacterized protein n=1 Tax=Cercophora newfieldiana TaxID=92897 RepID=A0AA40CQE0_9PEZI|nr:hypothetical protein B0T16DRAFT_411933 [Cercophora newfieldiana]